MKCRMDNTSENYLKEYRSILNTMIAGMCSAKLTESISHNFIAQMIPHHMAAIKMSENILKYTSDPKLEEIAKGIISEQTKSIENMQEILNSCKGLTNSCCEVNTYQDHVCRIMKIMIEGMKQAYFDNCINCDFIREMIPHHMGAVRMSRNALSFPICSELIPILNAIISSQEKGICQMRELGMELKCR